MFDIELRRVQRIIHRRYKRGLLTGKEVYIFGVSDSSRQIIQILRELEIEPCHVIDNDRNKQGGYCSRLKVISPEEISNPAADNKLFIMYTATSWREMVSQLKAYGVSDACIWRLNKSRNNIFKMLFL